MINNVVSNKRSRKPPIAKSLLDSAIAHMTGAIEIHNKPNFAHRHEIVCELAVTAWEKALKALLYQRKVKIFYPDGLTIDFNKTLRRTNDLIGAPFMAVYENLLLIYEYRCKAIHFYGEKLDPIMFGLLSETVRYFAVFTRNYFNKELFNPKDLGLLPIAYQRPFIPEDFLTSYSACQNSSIEVRDFLKHIKDAADRLTINGVSADSILVNFKVSLQNVNRIQNADFVVGIDNTKPQNATFTIVRPIEGAFRLTNDERAPNLIIKEDELIESGFNLTYQDVQYFIKTNLSHVRQNKEFLKVRKELEQDPNICFIRSLDGRNPKAPKKKFYSDLIFQKLIDLYPESEINESSYPTSYYDSLKTDKH